MKSLHPVFILASLVGACGNDSSSDVESVAPPPIPLSDVDYIDNLVPHHQDALEMADVDITRGAREVVRTMAAEMKAKQQQEIEQLLTIRARLDGTRTFAAMRDPHAERDMAALEGATGEQVDSLFLANMIPHHAGAVSLSHRALENLADGELREIADMTIVMQTREMNEMLDMLGR